MKQYGLLLLGATVALAACSGSDARVADSGGTPTGPSRSQSSTQGNVKVTNVRAFIKDGRVQAFVQGELGDGCNSLQGLRQQRTGNTVNITVPYLRQGETCTMIFQYVNEWVPLDGDFTPGDYDIRANDASVHVQIVRAGNGDLKIDPDPGPVPQPPYLPFGSAPSAPTAPKP